MDNSLFKAIMATVIGVIFGSVVMGEHSPIPSEDFDQDIKKSVVKITSENRVGTGFVVKLDQNTVYFITVAHVVEGDPSPTLKFFGDQEFKARVLYAESDNPDKGLALLSIKGDDIPDNVVSLDLSEKTLRNFNLDLEKRDKAIFTFGFPIGGANWAYTELTYSGQKGRDLHFSGNIHNGNSGGPLIKNGEVIGIITAKSQFVHATSAIAIKEFLIGSISSSIPQLTKAQPMAQLIEAQPTESDILTIDKTTQFIGIGYEELTTPRTVKEIIVIDTQSRNIESEIRGLKKYGAAYHYLIGPYGEIKLLVEESKVAYHTKGRNENSIGIGLIHVSGEKYSSLQLDSLISLLVNIVNRHNIRLSMIRASSQVDPKKKSDFPNILSDIQRQVKTRVH